MSTFPAFILSLSAVSEKPSYLGSAVSLARLVSMRSSIADMPADVQHYLPPAVPCSPSPLVALIRPNALLPALPSVLRPPLLHRIGLRSGE